MIPAFGKNLCDVLQVFDCIQIRGGLLAAETTIEVAAKRGVLAISSELADIVYMIRNVRECHLTVIFRTPRPARTDHPIIQSSADHSIPGDNRANLLIIKLALMWNERPAIIMTRKNKTTKTIQRFPESLIREMGQIQKNAQPLHLPQQFFSFKP